MYSTSLQFINAKIDDARKLFPGFTAEEEKELAEKMKQGDVAARDAIIYSTLGLIRTEVQRLHISNVEFEDLLQDGFLIMLEKISDFDPSRGTRFSTFIWPWVWQYVSKWNLPVKNRYLTLSKKIFSAKNILREQKGYEPSESEIAAYLGMDEAKLKSKMEILARAVPVSLDKPLSLSDKTDSDKVCFGDMIAENRYDNPEEKAISDEVSRVYKKALSVLNEKEYAIYTTCHGFSLEDDAHVSYHEAGLRLDMSHEGVRQNDKKAKLKVRACLVEEGILAA